MLITIKRSKIKLDLGSIAFHAFGFLVLAFLALPMIFSVLVSFSPNIFIELPSIKTGLSLRWYSEFFSNPRWIMGLRNSFTIGLIATVISFLVGLSTAIAFNRYKFRWKTTLNAVVMTPVFVPAVVIGMASLSFHHQIGLWGTTLSIAVAHSLWAIPLVFMVLQPTLASLDKSLEEAAQGMGASPLRVFFHVTLPLIMPGVLVSIMFAFIISVNEFVMALFLAVPTTQTLPTLIWPNLRYSLTPVVAAASSVLLYLSIIVLGLSAKIFKVKI